MYDELVKRLRTTPIDMRCAKVMYIDVMCSCCGNHKKLSNKKIEDTVNLIHSGWGSCGSALYCPDCSKTWKDRNGNRKMGDERNTFLVIMNLFYDAKKVRE